MVPNVFNNIRAPYNTFTVQIGAGIVQTVTIPDGFYEGAGLATAINTQLVALGTSVTTLTFAFFAVTNVQNRFRAISTDAQQIQLVLNGTLDRILGDTPTANLTGTTTIIPANTTVQFSEPNLAGERLVHIQSEKIGHSMAVTSAQPGTVDLAITVPFHDVVYGGMGHWAPADINSSRLDMAFSICLSNGVDISLWDSQMNPLSLPSNHEIELQCKIIHDKNTL
jgi:hypothetical protein